MPELKACPIETTFKIIGKKWTSLILRELFRGASQFSQLQKRVKGINSKILSHRLKELQRASILKKSVVSVEPVRIEYTLTEKGKQLMPILAAAMRFSMANLAESVFTDGKPRTFDALSGQFTKRD